MLISLEVLKGEIKERCATPNMQKLLKIEIFGAY